MSKLEKIKAYQSTLFPGLTSKFPSTRYQGSKSKLTDWIWDQIKELDFVTCLDAFGGTGSVAYRLKQEGKQVTYNDLLLFNYFTGLALIENSKVTLNSKEIEWLLQNHSDIDYPSFVYDNFSGIYFTDEENLWIDQTLTNIRKFENQYKFALAFFALCQSCIIKRPFNLFHRKNLYIRLAEVKRTFGNKVTWDKPFDEWFCSFLAEANEAVFDNGQKNYAYNFDAIDVPGEYDLVYIDTPYISKNGIAVNYLDFYHFLEGLALYDEWENHIDRKSKHLRFKPRKNDWTDKNKIHNAFYRLFQRYRNSIIVVSYRSDGIPSESELVSILREFKPNVRVERFGQYKYVLSNNSDSEEILLIGT